MPSIAKYRRTWFALLKEHGVAPEDRHDVQKAHTGKASLRHWTADDYETAIAALQRAAGLHRDRRAHVCEDADPEPGGWATHEQARYIADLVERVDWRRGPVAYLCSNVLRGDGKALRRERLRARADELGHHGPELWGVLTRDEADQAIQALVKAARIYPREEPAHVRGGDRLLH